MYQALYRKYRPRSFYDVTGQEHVTDTLRRQIITDRLSHAYLFVGTRGTGKTTCAKILSRAINCQDPIDGNPCNKCSSCLGIENGSILDVLELDAASNNGVDNIRALRDDAIYTPASVKKRVYILDEVHMLSTSAANALLKILEEPPEHLIFILATTELHKVPATIMSRCQRFAFKRISPGAIIERLNVVAENEGLTLTGEAAEKLAALADGSLRDALSLLDQCAVDTTIDMRRVVETIGLVGKQEIVDIVEAAAEGDIATTLSVLDAIYDNGRDMASLLSELAALIRDILVFKLSEDSPLLTGSFSRAELSSLSGKLMPERLFSHLEVIREATYSLSRGMSVKLTVEMCLIRICDDRLSGNTEALISRIAKLENSEFGIRNSESIGNSEFGIRNSESIGNSEFGIRNSESEENSEFGIRNSELGANSIDNQPEMQKQAPKPIDTEKMESGSNKEDKKNKDTDTDTGSGLAIDNQSETVNSEFRIPNSEFSPDSEFSPPPGDFESSWQSILEQLKSDVSIYSLLSDAAKVRAEMRDGALNISVGDVFTVSLIESKKFSDPLAQAAKKTLGQEVTVRVKLGTVDPQKTESNKLDSFMENFSSIIKREE